MVNLDAVDRRLNWANKQLADLKRRITVLRELQSYKVVVETDPERANHLNWILRIDSPTATEVIAEVVLRSGDVVHSLRSSLDYFSYAVVPLDRRDVQTAFPIYRNPRAPTKMQYEKLVRDKLRGASPNIVKALSRLQPYFGGNHEALRVVDYLDIVNKHHLLIAGFASYSRVNLNMGGTMRRQLATAPRPATAPSIADIPDTWIALRPQVQYPLENGQVLFSAPANTINENDARPDVEIAFGEPPQIVGQPVVATLTNLSKFVADVIEQLRRLV